MGLKRFLTLAFLVYLIFYICDPREHNRRAYSSLCVRSWGQEQHAYQIFKKDSQGLRTHARTHTHKHTRFLRNSVLLQVLL